jgi:hypothetical protein
MELACLFATQNAIQTDHQHYTVGEHLHDLSLLS